MAWLKILELYAEGGSLKLLGQKGRAGRWSYRVTTSENCFDESCSSNTDCLDWPSVLKKLSQYPWPHLFPDEHIHPEFRAKIALEVSRQLSRGEFIERWGALFGLPTDEDIWKGGLADPVLHWKVGNSAERLATCWRPQSNDFPDKVKYVLDSSKIFAGAELITGIPEHKVPLKGGRRASQNDIWLLVKIGNSFASVAVEGKVHESFGDTLTKWYHRDKHTAGRATRFEYLCSVLGLQGKCSLDDEALRYQLFHRTASAIIEAENLGVEHALMMVHTFAEDKNKDSFEDYRKFLELYNVKALRDSVVSTGCLVGENKNIKLHFAWVEGFKQ